MDASEDVAALKAEEQQATSCMDFVTAQQIGLSMRHWSELSKSIEDGISPEEVEKARLDNKEVFSAWKTHPKWWSFFGIFGDHSVTWESFGSLELGEKFAEGAQAELFHVRVKWCNPQHNEMDLECETEYVLKVFKEGTLVRDLQPQWPEGLLRYRDEIFKRTMLGIPLRKRIICGIQCATLLMDGRFAFLLIKEDGDLRSLIEHKMVESDHGCRPFSEELGEEIMYRVATGLDYLHSFDIVHRDMKASNVLVTKSPCGNFLWCYVADFESSIGVVGTGFWRAPEILQACRDRNIWKRPELFTREADIYSYGMTCYEVLTGKVPFENHPLRDECSLLTDLVIDQHLRPEVPDHVEDWARELLQWCWQSDCADRPSIKEILGILEANSSSKYIQTEVLMRLLSEVEFEEESEEMSEEELEED